jgi:muramidase (phage lysozyme)
MAMVRVQAFLKILRGLETAGYEDKDSYFVLPDGKDPVTGKVVRRSFAKTDTHPFDEDAPIKYDKKDFYGNINRAAGAYQIKRDTWDETIKATGWPSTFDRQMQDRIAIYRLQFRGVNTSNVRKTALGYLMEGKVEDAINESKLWNEWAVLPGAKKPAITMGNLIELFEKYVKEGAK